MVNIAVIANRGACPESHLALVATLHEKFGMNVLVLCTQQNVMWWSSGFSQLNVDKFKVGMYNHFGELEQNLLLNGFSFLINLNELNPGEKGPSQNENFEIINLRSIEDTVGTKSPLKVKAGTEYTFLTSNKSRVQFTLSPPHKNATKDETRDQLKPLLQYIYQNAFSHTAAQFGDDFIVFKTNRGNLNQLPINVGNQNMKLKNTINIYPMCNWQSSHDLIKMWNKFTNSDGMWKTRWGNIRFVTEKNKADFFIVINQAYEQFDPQRTLYFVMEPNVETTPAFRDFYAHLKRNRPLFWGTHDYQVNNTEWHLSPTQQDFIKGNVDISKKYDRVISAIVSEKNFDPGHKLRLNFLKELDTRASKGELPFEVHIYGSNSMNFVNYKGSLPPNQKDMGIFPYKYHFNAENNSIKNYITEKFTDAVLGESLMLYWGCPNITDYYHPDSFINLTLLPENYEAEIEMISETMKNDEWNKRLSVIREMKRRILTRGNMFSRFKTIIDLSKVQVYYKLNGSKMQNDDLDNQRGQILRDQSFNTIHYFNFKLDPATPEHIKLFSYLELFKAVVNSGVDFIIYPSESTLKVEDMYRCLSNTLSYYREETEEDVDVVVFSQANPTEVGFWMRVEVCEKMLIKATEILQRIGGQPVPHFTLSYLFGQFATKVIIK